jgi:adhesin transport system outer membrane protein
VLVAALPGLLLIGCQPAPLSFTLQDAPDQADSGAAAAKTEPAAETAPVAEKAPGAGSVAVGKVQVETAPAAESAAGDKAAAEPAPAAVAEKAPVAEPSPPAESAVMDKPQAPPAPATGTAAGDKATLAPAAGAVVVGKAVADEKTPVAESQVKGAAEGYNLASMSAAAATDKESPSPFGSLFGYHHAGVVLRPPGAGSADQDDMQRVSLVKLTLRDAVGLAIARHPDVSRAMAVVSQSAEDVLVAKGAWFPVANYSISPGYGNAFSRDNATGTQSSGGVSQLIWDFGKTSGRIEQADATLNRQRYTLTSTIEGVAYSAAGQYIECATAQALLDATREEIASLTKLRGMIADRVKASLSPASDLTQAEVALQRAILDQAQAQTRLDIAANGLGQVIGIRPKSVAPLVSVNEASGALKSDSRDIENAPAVLAAKAAVAEAEAQIKITKADYYPAVSLVGSKSSMSGTTNAYDTAWVGLALGGTISPIGQNRYRIESARASRDAAERQLDGQRLSMRTALASAEMELEGSVTRRTASDTMEKMSRTSRDLYWQEYVLNKRPLNQVLDADRDIFTAVSSRIAAIADGITARLKMQVAVGLLVKKLRDLQG